MTGKPADSAIGCSAADGDAAKPGGEGVAEAGVEQERAGAGMAERDKEVEATVSESGSAGTALPVGGAELHARRVAQGGWLRRAERADHYG